MKLFFRSVALFTPFIACTLSYEPWFEDLWEWQWDTRYMHGSSSHFQHDQKSERFPLKLRQFSSSLALVPLENWRGEIELGWKEPFSDFRSGAFQVSYLFSDDVGGDPLSIRGGIKLQKMTKGALRDFSYSAPGKNSGEIHLSLGKEWSKGEMWRLRGYAVLALEGAEKNIWQEWARLALQVNQNDFFQCTAMLEGHYGKGKGNRLFAEVPLELWRDYFQGYGTIAHRGVDAKIEGRVLLERWGSFSLGYRRRLYASFLPKDSKAWVFSYHLPFSPI